jgi:hypothetical protein
MKDLQVAELRPMIDVADRRARGLRDAINVGSDEGGRKRRALQRLELYTSVLKRLNRSDALMPEYIRAKERRHSAVLGMDE